MTDRAPRERQPGDGRPRDGARPASFALQALLLLAVFAGATAIAKLAGAANVGTAMGIGQIAFAIALVYLMLRR